MVNPEITDYLRILQKINENYTRYKVDVNKDLLDEINYYENKDVYSVEEIKELQSKCEIEWKDVLIKLFDGLITKINSKDDYKKILNVELEQAKKVKHELIKEKKTLEAYEKLYDFKLKAFDADYKYVLLRGGNKSYYSGNVLVQSVKCLK